MYQKKLNYIHYYFVAIISFILIWGGFEYITICNGKACQIDTKRLWYGLITIVLIFIPITLCIWSEYVNGQIKKLFSSIKLLYEEKTLIFAMAIFISLAIASLSIFNIWWFHFVKDAAPKEYMAALVNLSVFIATLFAPIAALILYDNWKIQHNLQLFSKEAKDIWTLFKEERASWREHYSTLENIPNNSMQLQDITSFKKLFEESLKKNKLSNRELMQFQELTDDNQLKDKLLAKINSVIKYNNKYEEQLQLGYQATNSTFRNMQGEYLHEIASNLIDIENYIRDKYILMK